MQGAKMALPAMVVGEVTEVELLPRHLVVHSRSWVRGGQELNLRVGVIDQTSIREGRVIRHLSDIRVGDKVWLKYERKDGTLVAESICIKSRAQ